MSCKSRIPSKTFSYTLSAGTAKELDTKGCDCLLKAVSGEVMVFVKNDNSEDGYYTLGTGETFTFCGKLYVEGNGSKVCGMMYTTV